MKKQPLHIEKLRDLIRKGDIVDPLVFLESVMTGQDPRKYSSIYNLVMEIDSFSGGDLSKGDWAEIVEHVTNHCRYKQVSLGESINASKTLAEYLHPKRKQVELTDGSDNSGGSNSPLTEEEIELFKEKFNEDF
jgi:hypothetical protein